MLDEKWDAIGLLLQNGWPGEFDDDAQGAYRILLDGYEPEAVVEAVRVLVRCGGRFRPSVSEIAAELNSDPGRPSWSEAYRLLFGIRGLLTVRPEQAAIDRASQRHPLLAAFIRQEGYDRLTMLQVHDPDWGEKVRNDLERAWNRLEERADHRTAAGLEIDTVGRRQQIGPHRPDYLATLPEAPAR